MMTAVLDRLFWTIFRPNCTNGFRQENKDSNARCKWRCARRRGAADVLHGMHEAFPFLTRHSGFHFFYSLVTFL
jgi:hypothetical protein